MPDISQKLGLSLPLSNETFTRESYCQNLIEIDEKTALQSQVNEPFFLKSAIYNTGLNSVDLTFGKGRANFNGTLINKTGDSTYTISSPTTATDYYIYLKNDGTYTHNTNGVVISGAVLIWKVGTGATLGQLTLNDQRDQLPGAAAKAVYDNLAGTGRTTETIKGNTDAITTHLADYIRQPGYGTTGGSANTYTLTLNPALSAYTAGVCVAVKIHAANTATSTININGLGAKTIKDSKGNNLTSGKLVLNSIYTMRYDGTNFILQGEGGSGNATASDLLSGKTANVDAGDITGTMPNRGALSTDITTKAQEVTISEGYHSGSGTVKIASTEQTKIIDSNIKKGVTILGVQGSVIPNELPTGNNHIISAADAQVTIPSSSSYIKVKETTVNIGFYSLRFALDLRGPGVGGSYVSAYLYKNGVYTGMVNTKNDTSWETFHFNVTDVQAEDSFSIYCSNNSSSGTAYIRYFRITIGSISTVIQN